MRVMQLIWLCLLALQTTLIAQNNSINITPAQRVLTQQTAFATQEFTDLFTADRSFTTPIEEVSNYHILQLDEEQRSSLLFEAPNLLKLNMPGTGSAGMELQLVRVETPSPIVVESAGNHPVNIQHAVHYQGIIAGDPTSLVALSVLDDEIIGLVSAEQLGGNYVLGRLPATGERSAARQPYVFYQDREIFQEEHFSCATADTGESYLREELSDMVEGSRTLDDCVQIYFEVNYDIFLDKGSSVQATAQYVEALFNQVATIYASEQVNMRISEILVWNTPSPYTGTSSGQMLTDFQNNRTSFNGDLAQLLSYRASGGIAVVNGLCHPLTIAKMSYSGISSSFQQVPTYSWSVMVVAHELGHLLGSQHTHACVWNGNSTAIDSCPGYTEGSCQNPGTPSGGGTVMSYCHLTQVGINLSRGFGTQPGNLIRNRVAAASCLSTCPSDGGNGGGNPPTTECEQEPLFLRLQLDTYSPETTWSITNDQGAVVAQGGAYGKTLANTLVLDTLCLPEGCYNFQINDAYNDGICCAYGNGSYTLLDAEQQLIAQGGEFPGSEAVSFCLPYEEGNGGDDCESIDFNDYTIDSYGLNQDAGSYSVLDDGETLYLENNAWKSIAFPYEITRSTVIAFDFRSTRQGEIHGIGFDNNVSISYGYTFKVHGTQNWGLANYDNYTGDASWQSYEIPVGEFYVGTADRLFFATDHDGGARNGNSWFRNVRIYEGTDCQTGGLVNGMSATLGSDAGMDLSIAPNPVVNEQFQLRVGRTPGGQASWQILSLTGQVIREQQRTTDEGFYEEQINTNTLASGIYLLRWRDEINEKTLRFTVQ
ncbi:MAG: M12 family metallo-peptidase [Bacteroidota bacterium]